MREVLDPWPFIAAAYAIGIGATLALIAWSWLSMRHAEKRRDKARERGADIFFLRSGEPRTLSGNVSRGRTTSAAWQGGPRLGNSAQSD